MIGERLFHFYVENFQLETPSEIFYLLCPSAEVALQFISISPLWEAISLWEYHTFLPNPFLLPLRGQYHDRHYCRHPEHPLPLNIPIGTTCLLFSHCPMLCVHSNSIIYSRNCNWHLLSSECHSRPWDLRRQRARKQPQYKASRDGNVREENEEAVGASTPGGTFKWDVVCAG